MQVAPAELEAVILSHPAVADVGVVGIPDSDAGELPRAYVVVKEGHQLSAAQLKEHVAGKKTPNNLILFLIWCRVHFLIPLFYATKVTNSSNYLNLYICPGKATNTLLNSRFNNIDDTLPGASFSSAEI